VICWPCGASLRRRKDAHHRYGVRPPATSPQRGGWRGGPRRRAFQAAAHSANRSRGFGKGETRWRRGGPWWRGTGK
jgi:hypothetical protein